MSMEPIGSYDRFYSKETYKIVGEIIRGAEQKYHFKALFGRISGSQTQGIASRNSDNDFVIFVDKTEGNIDTNISGMINQNVFINGILIAIEIRYIYWNVVLRAVEERNGTIFAGYPTNFYRTKEEAKQYLPQHFPKGHMRKDDPFLIFNLLLLGDSAWVSGSYPISRFMELYSYEKTVDVLDTFYVRGYGNYIHYIQGKEKVLLRRYLNAFFQLWVVQWLLEKRTKPPMMVHDLMNIECQENIRCSVMELIAQNKEVTLDKEKVYILRQDTLSAYIDKLLKQQRAQIGSYSREEMFADIIYRTPLEGRQKIFCEEYQDWWTPDLKLR